MKSKIIRTGLIALIFMISFLYSTVAEAENLKNSSMVKNITIEGGAFSTEFKAGNDTYSVYLEEFQQNLTVNVELNDSRFQYTVEGETSLSRDDDNVVYVDVIVLYILLVQFEQILQQPPY